MGYELTERVYESELPDWLLPMALAIAHLVVDPRARKQANPNGPRYQRQPLEFYASVAVLMRRCRVSRRTVQRHLRELEHLGFLVPLEKGGGRRLFSGRLAGVRTNYLINPEALDQLTMAHFAIEKKRQRTRNGAKKSSVQTASLEDAVQPVNSVIR